MMLFRKMHCHVWNTFILLAFLLSSCCLSPVEDEVVIDVCQDVSMETVSIVNVIDTFYRRSPEFFFANSVMFDKEPRGKFLLHSHGYACKVDSGNMLASLAEAAWYLGMERNRDLVRINLDSLAVKNENDSKLSSDYARAISVGNIPTYNVQISKTQSVPLPVKTEKGMIGFGSWGTEVEFKDIRIEADGKTTFYDVSCCKADSGEWKVQDGVLIQTSRQLRTRAILPDFIGNEYVLTFRARRTRGDEGFFLYYGVSADGKKGYCVNVGRWTNQFINIEDLEGEVFEGSNDAGFRKKDTLYLIEEKPVRLYNVAYVDKSKGYRYLRYYGPAGSYCNISEVGFYRETGDTIPLKGQVIGTPGSFDGDKGHWYMSAFDGDPYTSFDYKQPDGGWAGIDFGKPVSVGKIVFTPRNRVNFIRKGDKYELFYAGKGGWISAGTTVANSDSLVYNVPKGALLYLKNHSGGVDERIFGYVDGEQVFW